MKMALWPNGTEHAENKKQAKWIFNQELKFPERKGLKKYERTYINFDVLST